MSLSKSFLIILLILLGACGLRPVHQNSTNNFSIKSYEINGNKEINQILEPFFIRLKDKNENQHDTKIKINSKVAKNISAKDSSGNPTSFDMKITVKLMIIKKNSETNSNSFTKNINYNNLSSQFELKQYEAILIQSITNQIISEINLYLTTINDN